MTKQRMGQARSPQRRLSRRWVSFFGAFALTMMGLIGCSVFTATSEPTAGTPSGNYADRIGVEGSIEFVDRIKMARPFEKVGGGGLAPMDEQGYPTTDAQIVVFDDRPIPAWSPPIDDPQAHQPDVSGTYKLSFNGQANISAAGTEAQITNQSYEASTNTTTADVTIAPNAPALLLLTFTDTKRRPDSQRNTGLTNLKLIRPGYADRPTQLFTDRLLKAYAPFKFIRFMGLLHTNYDTGYYGDAGHHIFEWNERSLPSDVSQQEFKELREGKRGLAWEYVIQLANATNKDVWINIPVSASGASPSDTNSYIYQLAKLFKQGNELTGNEGLKPGLKIYLEHSNEVWNYGFSQYTWNKLAAQDEVAQGNSPLNKDGNTDPETWARRRHAKRLYEAAKIFEAVYGPGSLGSTIRPVYAHWTIFPEQYLEVLTWMNNTYGPPRDYFWGLAQTHYLNEDLAGDQASVSQVLQAMRSDSDNGVVITKRLQDVAHTFGLEHVAYEAGPDVGGGQTTNVGNRIMANRNPAIKPLIEYHMRHNWFDMGGNLYSFFTLSGLYSRYGAWGLTDDLANLNTAKFQAIYALTGQGRYSPESDLPPPLTSAKASTSVTLPAPTDLTAQVGNTSVTLTWKPVNGATNYNVFYTTGGNFQQIASGLTEPRYTHTGLTNGTQYTYFVTAVQGSDTSSPSAPINATPR